MQLWMDCAKKVFYDDDKGVTLTETLHGVDTGSLTFLDFVDNDGEWIMRIQSDGCEVMSFGGVLGVNGVLVETDYGKNVGVACGIAGENITYVGIVFEDLSSDAEELFRVIDKIIEGDSNKDLVEAAKTAKTMLERRLNGSAAIGNA